MVPFVQLSTNSGQDYILTVIYFSLKQWKMCNLSKITMYYCFISKKYIYRAITFPTFLVILDLFKQIFEHIKRPLLGLSWTAEIYKPEYLRGGSFSIRVFYGKYISRYAHIFLLFL